MWNKIIIDKVNINNNKSLILGDFNCKHSAWNCRSDCLNGKRLWNCIQDSDIIKHNTTTQTRVDPHSGTLSNIDLILSNNELSHRIRYHVNDDTWESDHFPIFVNISVENLYTGNYLFNYTRFAQIRWKPYRL